MENGENNHGNGNQGFQSNQSDQSGQRYTYSYTGSSGGGPRIAGFEIKPLYMYIAIGVAILFLFYFLMQVFNTSLTMHFSLAAGILLLLGNVREFFQPVAEHQHKSSALMNSLIGGSLIFAWMSQLFGYFLWVPALLLIGVSVPLVLGRAQIYRGYLHSAQGMAQRVRQMAGRATNRWN
jgi:hypothetical protein